LHFQIVYPLSITSYAVGAGIESKLSAHLEQGTLPNSLNEPPVVVVRTQVEYLVLVLIAHAVTGLQSQFTNGYVVVVTPPIVITTGASIVVVAGMV
jgi:hypothetical protein